MKGKLYGYATIHLRSEKEEASSENTEPTE